jgi:xylan 1,4-beta-xylosidase
MRTVDFWCDLSKQGTQLLHCWEHTVGSCHAPIALRADWQQQLRRCRSELGFRYVRTYSDIFEENYFPSVPFHGGFGLLTVHDIAKPTYRAFELLHKLGNQRLLVDGLHETVNAWVTRDDAGVKVLLVNHALPRHPIARVRVQVHLTNAPEPSAAWVERIDENHANAKRRWQALGAQDYLDGPAVEQLHEASRLRRQACPWRWREERIALEIELPPHGVAALTVELAPA